jgi:phosphoribosylamine--glycine ligase
MEEQGIPTARFGVFESLEPALGYLANQTVPVVIKAAGLAAGKGVVIARTLEEARLAVSGMLSGTSFGAAGRKVVVEEWLEGEEASIIGLCDGEHFVLLVPSQDHKRLRDNDEGPNTGGMGAYAPAPVVTREVEKQAADRVFGPAIAGLRRRGIDYRGVIYAGVMLTRQGLRLLEFNCRFGDPETQAVMPLLGTDLAELAVACIDGRLAGQAIKWSGGSALCVVAAAPGYPESYPRGVPIAGLAPVAGDLVVFHAGTRLHEGQVVTDGGRVLGVTGMGLTLSAARDAAYRGIEQIRFEGMHFRKDIGARGLRAASQVRA